MELGVTNYWIGLSAAIGVQDVGNQRHDASFTVCLFPVANGALAAHKSGENWGSEVEPRLVLELRLVVAEPQRPLISWIHGLSMFGPVVPLK